jgi:Leucine-rich repeat (LRR) protein
MVAIIEVLIIELINAIFYSPKTQINQKLDCLMGTILLRKDYHNNRRWRPNRTNAIKTDLCLVHLQTTTPSVKEEHNLYNIQVIKMPIMFQPQD